jgi:hypothetical protein
MNALLQHKMEVGIFSGYLELDISEMKDDDLTLCFNEARRVIKEDGIQLFTQQLGVFRECTSIVARIATLASLTSRNSWPILSLTAALPLFDQLLGMIPWYRAPNEDCMTPIILSHSSLVIRCDCKGTCIKLPKTPT